MINEKVYFTVAFEAKERINPLRPDASWPSPIGLAAGNIVEEYQDLMKALRLISELDSCERCKAIADAALQDSSWSKECSID